MLLLLLAYSEVINNKNHKSMDSFPPKLEEDGVLIYDSKGSVLECGDKKTSLVCCLSADLNMDNGVAAHFRDAFGRVDELSKQNPVVGSCIHLRDEENRYIFYLITKQHHWDVPRFADFEKAMDLLVRRCFLYNIKHLAFQFSGNKGKADMLDWTQVKESMFRLFETYFEKFDIDVYIQDQ